MKPTETQELQSVVQKLPQKKSQHKKSVAQHSPQVWVEEEAKRRKEEEKEELDEEEKKYKEKGKKKTEKKK